ncbi:MAG: tetratricopeptide repeat protein [Deltaproteobacteria bacterium]|nr:tetratricopeptide repeat protein [Deltaproteobacteria bacterium]
MKSTQTQTLTACLALFIITALLYAGALKNPLVYDSRLLLDHHFYRELFNQFTIFDKRWISHLSFYAVYKICGENILFHRLINILVHASNAILVFFMINRFAVVFEKKPTNAHSQDHQILCFFGALLFAVHPVAVYTTAYLIQRSMLLATFFTLLTILTYLKALQQKSFWFTMFATALYFFAIHAKEHVIMLPFFLFVITCFYKKSVWQSVRDVFVPFVMFILIAAEMTLRNRGILFSLYEPHGQLMASFGNQNTLAPTGLEGLQLKDFYPLSILNQSLLFFKYMLLWIIPLPGLLSIDCQSVFPQGLKSWPHLLGLGSFCLYPLIVVTLVIRRHIIPAAALLFPWVMFFTEFAAVRYTENFVLYRSYLWASGLFLLMPCLSFIRYKKILYTALILLSVVCVLESRQLLKTFSSEYELWSDAEQKMTASYTQVPGSYRITDYLGTELVKRKDYHAAVQYLSKSIRLRPYNPFVHHNLAVAKKALKQYDEAKEYFFNALMLETENADPQVLNRKKSDVLFGLAESMIADQNTTGAAAYLEAALVMTPSHVNALNRLGLIRHNENKHAASQALFNRVLKIDPDNQLAREALKIIKDDR